jgi:hypothetical protein
MWPRPRSIMPGRAVHTVWIVPSQFTSFMRLASSSGSWANGL